jgi:hypothetical protein
MSKTFVSTTLAADSALANVHPCLVADPQSPASMFAAAGINIDPDVKTITAKTLFERLTHLSKRFDQKTKDFCTNISLKRNAELHSGEVPFEGVIPGSWEGRFWHTAEIVLEAMGSSLESWLGANEAKAPKALLTEYTLALREMAKVKVETAAEEFRTKKTREQKELQAKAAALEPWDVRRSFKLRADGIWDVKCPACASKAFVAGVQYYGAVADEHDGEDYEETIDVAYLAEELHCPACQLHLENRESIEAVGIEVDHEEQEIRQREYEPDYGND